MSKPMTRMVIYVGIFFLLVFGWYGIKKIFIGYMMSHYKMPPVTISSIAVVEKDWQSFLESVGTLSAVNGVDLSTEAAGIVSQIHINSGQQVKKGDPIVELDTSLQKAELKDKEARLKLARMDYERDKKLYERKVQAQSVLDKSLANLLQAEAGFEMVNAEIKQKTITAPFDGRVGIKLVNVGQYVSPGTPIVTLQSLKPLYVDFNLPEQYIKDLYINQAVDVAVNYQNQKPIRGFVSAVNAKVDQTTRNILVQATIPNDNQSLYPGMYALVKVWLKQSGRKLVVPQTAISYSLSGDYVFVIKNEGDKKNPDLHVYRQYVKVGERRGDEVVILNGLKKNDLVVSSGQLKLRNGAAVLINNKLEL